MKRKLRALFVLVTFLPLLLSTSTVVLAAEPPRLGEDDTSPPSGGFRLENPLGEATLTSFLQDLLGVIMVFAIPLIVFMIIYAGFNYVMAKGDATKVKKAHLALLYAVIGGVIIIGANAILAVIQGTVDAFRP